MPIWLRFLLFGWFILSQAGYALFLVKKRLPVAFAPVVLIAGQLLLLYLAGFAGCLQAAQTILAAAGTLLLLYSFRKETVKSVLRSPMFWLFVVLAVGNFWIVAQERLSNWDDYSHWGRIAKALTGANGYPTQESAPDISHISYAPGMALWITYVARFVRFGKMEGVWIWAHNLVSFACVCAAFAPLSRQFRRGRFVENAICAVVTGLCAVLILGLNNQLYNLLVDGSVGVLTAAAFAIYLSGSFANASYKWLALPVLCTIPIVKNSGLLFALVFVLFLLLSRSALKRDGKRTAFAVACAALPLLFWGAWQLFVGTHWESVQSSAQAVSFARFSASYMDKMSSGRIADILDIFMKAVFCGSNAHVATFWGVLFGMVAIRVYISGKAETEAAVLGPAFSALIAGGLLYLLCLALTYLLSMTEHEALNLVCFDRYLNAFSVLLFLMLAFAVSHFVQDEVGRMPLVRIVCFLLLPTLMMTGFRNGWQPLDPKNAYLSQNAGYTDFAIRELAAVLPERMDYNTDMDNALLILGEPKASAFPKVGYDSYWRYMLGYHIRMPFTKIVPAGMDTAEEAILAIAGQPRTIVVIVGDSPDAVAAAARAALPVYKLG